ncbi:MAG: aspartate aminotransferase family protein [Thermodesulfobacteriota bacterium]
MDAAQIMATEDRHMPGFFKKIPIVIERGEGVAVWDTAGRRYLDFTSGWGVTAIGHASPVIRQALADQAGRILQGPSAGLTYSPARAELLALLVSLLPPSLSRVFFANSGAEANDAVIKLARKVTGRLNVIATLQGFHGRTISTASATGQAKHRERFNPLMPNYLFVPFNDLTAMEETLDNSVAAVLLEPIQGEGGVNVPDPGYLPAVSALCQRHGACLIVDEVQTGFGRTGKMFAVDGLGLAIDFMTMGKGIAGGFPFAAFAVTEQVAARLERGDHGGTYCGNPLGCAVAKAVIEHLLGAKVLDNVRQVGQRILSRLQDWQGRFPGLIAEARGQGLLLAMVMTSPAAAEAVYQGALAAGLFLNLTQDKIVRLFPALTLTQGEAEEGLAILEAVLTSAARSGAAA